MCTQIGTFLPNPNHITIMLHLLLLLTYPLQSGAQYDSLYGDTPEITKLSADNYAQIVYNNPQKGFFVEFYKSTCAHCRHFAPVYKEFARDVSNWNSAIELVAVSCAEETEFELCRRNNVTHIPYFKVGWYYEIL